LFKDKENKFGIPEEDLDKILKHYSVPHVVKIDDTRTDCYFQPYPEWIPSQDRLVGPLNRDILLDQGARALNLKKPVMTIDKLDYTPKPIPQPEQANESSQDSQENNNKVSS
jgi:hypothetical protein